MSAKIKTFSSSARHKHRPKGVSKKKFEKTFWPYLPLLIATSLTLLFGQNSSLVTALRHPHGRVLAYATSMSISSLLANTNAQRTSNGVATLSLNSQLDAAAQAKANDMATRNYWSHNTPEGNPPWIFVNAQGYSYQKLGENLATGFSDEQSTISGWMASPPHKENLLDSRFTEVGFGYANNPDYTSAGGGPMTIVVAFYGQPQVLASSVAQAPAPTPASTSSSSPSPPTSSTPPNSTPSSQESEPNTAPVEKKGTPNTNHQINNTLTPSVKPTHAQVALANMPVSNIATGLAIFGLFSALLIWVSKHLVVLRRVVLSGERYAIRHPIADVGLVVTAGVCYLLTQTAGLVR